MGDLIIYTEKPVGNCHRGKFLYVKTNAEVAKKIKKMNFGFCSPAPDEKEVHLTTNGAFDRYCEKRLVTPKYLLILDTQAEMDNLLEALGYWR